MPKSRSLRASMAMRMTSEFSGDLQVRPQQRRPPRQVLFIVSDMTLLPLAFELWILRRRLAAIMQPLRSGDVQRDASALLHLQAQVGVLVVHEIALVHQAD